MTSLRVLLNNEQLTIASHKDLAVLVAYVGARGKLGKTSIGTNKLKDTHELMMSVSGTTTDDNGELKEHLYWIKQKKLKVGDEIIVQIINSDFKNEPIERKKHDADEMERWRRKIDENIEKKYGQKNDD